MPRREPGEAQAVPLLFLSGFLGAGKTTLLGRWLADPDFADTAIVVDHAGDIALDAHLVGGGKLPGGTSVRGAAHGFAAALAELANDRQQRKVAPFERVVVETPGLDDPLRLLEALDADAALRELYPVHGVVTAIDALDGIAQLESQRASRAQAQMADALVITKADLADAGGAERLARELLRINPQAEILRVMPGHAHAAQVWNAVSCASGRDLRRMRAAMRDDGAADEAVGSLRVRFPHAVELSGFCVRLAAFLETHARKVLRVKGLIRVEGRHGPAVIQAVGRMLYPVRTLREWPAGWADSALVVTAAGLDDDEIRMAVAGEAARGRSSRSR